MSDNAPQIQAQPFFDDARKELLRSFLPEYLKHQDARTVGDFWSIVTTAYLKSFPEDDVPTAIFTRTKTKAGRFSKKRPAGVAKPLREVRHMSLFVAIMDS
jgi:hypothetical protein